MSYCTTGTLVARDFDYPWLREAWDQLIAKTPGQSVFQTFGWNRVWWQCFGKGEPLLVVVLEDDEAIAIAPLYVDGDMVFFVGSGGSDGLDVVGKLSGADAAETLLGGVRTIAPDLLGLRLYHVPDESPTGPLLQRAAAAHRLECFDEGELAAPVLTGGPTALSDAAARKSLVRHERVFANLGGLEVRHLTEAGDIEPFLDAFFDQHIRRWAGTDSPSLFLDSRQQQFYRALVASPLTKEWLRFTAILSNEQPIAFHLGMSHAGRFLWYKPSFEVDLARRSPGEVLQRQLFLAAEEEGCNTFDFGIGDEAFKYRFATETPLVRTWGFYPAGTALRMEG